MICQLSACGIIHLSLASCQAHEYIECMEQVYKTYQGIWNASEALFLVQAELFGAGEYWQRGLLPSNESCS